jgi:hypothetical protein
MQENNSNKIILDLCGGTGSWSLPYKEAGYDVRVITTPDYDVRTYTLPEQPIYGILAAPPCTMFSDARTHAKTPRDLPGGMEIVNACTRLIHEAQYRISSDQSKVSPLKFWALENPWYGRLKWFVGHPVFVFDPWEFGDGYKKRTALWGYFNLPKKSHTDKPDISKFDKLLMVDLKNLKGVNNSDYWKQTKLRQTLRSITPKGFAQAFFEANK